MSPRYDSECVLALICNALQFKQCHVAQLLSAARQSGGALEKFTTLSVPDDPLAVRSARTVSHARCQPRQIGIFMSIVLVTFAVPMKNSEDDCQSLFDDGVICPDCVRSRIWLVPVEPIGFVAHVTLKRQFWTGVDIVQKTKLRNDCKELDEDGHISDEQWALTSSPGSQSVNVLIWSMERELQHPPWDSERIGQEQNYSLDQLASDQEDKFSESNTDLHKHSRIQVVAASILTKGLRREAT
ncbi:hypothetical protein EDD22DRAFT_846932 [Suillus occidentalis]|nr:hypothetical protein EDD22DRAFT_846932 [Suillus occidentalis]